MICSYFFQYLIIMEGWLCFVFKKKSEVDQVFTETATNESLDLHSVGVIGCILLCCPSLPALCSQQHITTISKYVFKTIPTLVVPGASSNLKGRLGGGGEWGQKAKRKGHAHSSHSALIPGRREMLSLSVHCSLVLFSQF